MASRFWVGGTGTWDASDTTHWDSVSGGSGGNSVPGSSDVPIFDGNSGSGTATLQYSPSTLQWVLSNYGGTLDLNGFSPTIPSLTALTSTMTLKLGSGTITVTNSGFVWNIESTVTIVPGSSTILFTNSTNGTLSFGRSGAGFIYNNVWFSRGSSTGAITLVEAGTFNDFKDTGTGAHTITFVNSTTSVSTFSVSGIGSSNLISLSRTGASGTFTLSAPSGIINSSNLSISNSIATGGATWNAINSTDGGGNSGWIFTNTGGFNIAFV